MFLKPLAQCSRENISAGSTSVMEPAWSMSWIQACCRNAASFSPEVHYDGFRCEKRLPIHQEYLRFLRSSLTSNLIFKIE